MASTLQQSPRISIRDVLFIIFAKIHILISTFVLIVVMVVGHAFLATPVYEVSGSVLLKPLFDSRMQLHTLGRFEVLPVSQQDINSEIRIMTSDELLSEVATALDLASESRKSLLARTLVALKLRRPVEPQDAAVNYLKKNLAIKPITMSNMIEVRMRGEEPARIAKIVNTFLNHYIDRHIEVHRTGGGIEFYNQQTDLAHQKLAVAENALIAFQGKWSIIKIEAQRSENVRFIRFLRENLSTSKAQAAETGTKIRRLKAFLADKNRAVAMPTEFRTNEVIIDLQRALTPLLVEKERIAVLYPDSSVEYQDAERQVKRIHRKIRQEQEKLLAGLALDLSGLQQREAVLTAEIERISAESKLLTQKEVELKRHQRQVVQAEKNYQLYLDKTEEARIESQRDDSRVANISVSNWARAPSFPVYPRKILMAVLSIVVGVIAGIGCAFAAYYMDHTIKSPEDIQRWCGIRVYAVVANMERSDE